MNPLFKVLLVEDEVVTREGIRDNVNWNAHGFQFCGDAPDGEIALSMIELSQPDVIITDIKMPFMDGLQLCRIVRERMPWIKIIILSGHDEFEYAHEAINLGVKEYLLKPVTVEDLHAILDKMAKQLEQEKIEEEELQVLKSQVEENRAILRERFLLKLVLGAMTSTEAMEKSQLLGLNLVARYYLVVLIRVGLADRSEQFDYDEYNQVQQIIASLIGSNPDAFLLKKDWEEFVLLMKGNTPEFLEEERDLILEHIHKSVENTRYQINIGIGSPKSRIAHIYQSFIEAVENIQNNDPESRNPKDVEIDKSKLLKLDQATIDDFLRCGIKEDASRFFDSFIQPLDEQSLQSYLVKNYIFVDIVLATAKFVEELGGGIDQVIAEFNSIEKVLRDIKTTQQLKEQVCKILVSTLTFRDTFTSSTSQYAGLIKQAKIFINLNYKNPDLGLNEVAAQVSLSPSHFSVIFSQENCQTFKEYLTEVRIQKAKELLRTTALGATEISSQIGYNDPHYFSYVFKKNTGMSPTDFRLQTQTN